jgi:hypothetical protein
MWKAMSEEEERQRRINLILDALEGIGRSRESLRIELGLTTEEIEQEMSSIFSRLIKGLKKETAGTITPRSGSLFLGYLDLLRNDPAKAASTLIKKG